MSTLSFSIYQTLNGAVFSFLSFLLVLNLVKCTLGVDGQFHKACWYCSRTEAVVTMWRYVSHNSSFTDDTRVTARAARYSP